MCYRSKEHDKSRQLNSTCFSCRSDKKLTELRKACTKTNVLQFDLFSKLLQTKNRINKMTAKIVCFFQRLLGPRFTFSFFDFHGNRTQIKQSKPFHRLKLVLTQRFYFLRFVVKGQLRKQNVGNTKVFITLNFKYGSLRTSSTKKALYSPRLGLHFVGISCCYHYHNLTNDVPEK